MKLGMFTACLPELGLESIAEWSRSVRDNCRTAEQVTPPLVRYADSRGVKLVIENCPMEGWHPDGYPANLAYSPELWEWMFSLCLYLNYDPSHLLPLGIDPVSALKPYVDRVLHVQAKTPKSTPSTASNRACKSPGKRFVR